MGYVAASELITDVGTVSVGESVDCSAWPTLFHHVKDMKILCVPDYLEEQVKGLLKNNHSIVGIVSLLPRQFRPTEASIAAARGMVQFDWKPQGTTPREVKAAPVVEAKAPSAKPVTDERIMPKAVEASPEVAKKRRRGRPRKKAVA